MADNTIEFEILARLDKAEKAILTFKKDVKEQLGDVSFSLNITAFNQGLEIVKKAYNSAKKVIEIPFEIVFDAEKIKTIENQFQLLSNQAGLTGESLKASLEKSADGLAENTDLLQAANRAIILLGSNAEKIPEILELGRRATTAFGGDLIQNFELINQAIATGNTRALRQVGIIVDADKAYKNYAKSIGSSVAYLSEAGRQQAILNAVLEKGKTSFSGVNDNTLNATKEWIRFKNSIKDAADTLEIAFNATFGPIIGKTLKALRELADQAATGFKAGFGEGAEAAAAKIKILNSDLENLEKNGEAAFLSTGAGATKFSSALLSPADKIKEIRQQLELLNEEQRKLNEFSKDKIKIVEIDPDILLKIKAQAAEIKSTIASLNVETAELTQEGFTEQERQINIGNAKALAENELFNAKKFQMQIAFNAASKENQILIHQEMEALEQNHRAKIEEIRRNSDVVGLALSKSFQQTLGKGIAGAVQNIVSSLLKGQNAFQNFGKFILGLIGDFAIQVGTTVIAAGIAYRSLGDFTGTSPIIFGAALVALGTILKTLAGAGGGEDLAAGGGGGGGGGVAGAPTGGGFATQAQQIASQAGTNVVVNVQGNVLDRRESGLEIAQVIQQYFDNNGKFLAGAGV